MMAPEGRVMTVGEMEEAKKRPAYKPVQVQTAEGITEIWQMLPDPEDIIQFPNQNEQKKAA